MDKGRSRPPGPAGGTAGGASAPNGAGGAPTVAAAAGGPAPAPASPAKPPARALPAAKKGKRIALRPGVAPPTAPPATRADAESAPAEPASKESIEHLRRLHHLAARWTQTPALELDHADAKDIIEATGKLTRRFGVRARPVWLDSLIAAGTIAVVYWGMWTMVQEQRGKRAAARPAPPPAPRSDLPPPPNQAAPVPPPSPPAAPSAGRSAARPAGSPTGAPPLGHLVGRPPTQKIAGVMMAPDPPFFAPGEGIVGLGQGGIPVTTAEQRLDTP